MKFPLTSLSGYQFRLLLLPPNWDKVGTEITHTIDTDISVGRTDIEERRPGRAAMKLSQKCTLQLLGNDADDWRKGLAALGALPVGMPLWIDTLPVARWGERIYDPQQIVNFDPSSGAFTFYTPGTLPGSPTYSHLAPLIVGRFPKGRPQAEAYRKDMADVDLVLDEASPYSFRIGVHAYGSGWTAQPDRTLAPVRDTSDYGLEEIRLSAAREPGLDRTSSAPRWKQEGMFRFMDRLEIRRALTHFVDRQGALKSWFPVPTWFQPGADTSATPDNLTARFASDLLSFKYINGAIAESRVAFLQEIYTPTVAQEQPGECYLYRLKYDFDPSNPELFTSWDAPLTVGSEVFSPAQIAHQEIRKSLKPQDERAEISMAYSAGSLMADWLLGRLYARVRLTVWLCDPADPSGTRKVIFSGFVDEVNPDGNVGSITASLLSKALRAKAPGWIWGPRCNSYLFAPTGCGLSEDSFTSAGTISPSDVTDGGRTITVHGVSGFGGTSYAENWFASGVIRTGAGRNKMVTTILSSAMSGGNLVVKLNRPLWADKVSSGQAVTLLPGCDLQKSTCVEKFDNYAPATAGRGFRGAAFIPDYIETHAPGAPKGFKK